MITIHFYLDNEGEPEITTFYDMPFDPFKIGDEVNLSVEDIYPKDVEKYKDDFKIKLYHTNNEKKEQFHLKKVKIVRAYKSVTVHLLRENVITN